MSSRRQYWSVVFKFWVIIDFQHINISLVHSHWSRNVETWLSLVERIIVLLRQLSYAIKNQLGHPKPPKLLVDATSWFFMT